MLIFGSDVFMLIECNDVARQRDICHGSKLHNFLITESRRAWQPRLDFVRAEGEFKMGTRVEYHFDIQIPIGRGLEKRCRWH